MEHFGRITIEHIEDYGDTRTFWVADEDGHEYHLTAQVDRTEDGVIVVKHVKLVPAPERAPAAPAWVTWVPGSPPPHGRLETLLRRIRSTYPDGATASTLLSDAGVRNSLAQICDFRPNTKSLACQLRKLRGTRAGGLYLDYRRDCKRGRLWHARRP